MIINLTPYQINIHGVINGVPSVNQVSPSGNVARVAATYVAGPVINYVQTYRRTSAAVQGLPAPQSRVIYVVSAQVAAANPREDVYSPGELFECVEGEPIRCNGLVSSI